jgi:hypothetical protein
MPFARRQEKIAMNLRALFEKEVRIRLTEENNAFVCTVRRGSFRANGERVCLSAPDRETCDALVPTRKVRAMAHRLLNLIG